MRPLHAEDANDGLSDLVSSSVSNTTSTRQLPKSRELRSPGGPWGEADKEKQIRRFLGTCVDIGFFLFFRGSNQVAVFVQKTVSLGSQLLLAFFFFF